MHPPDLPPYPQPSAFPPSCPSHRCVHTTVHAPCSPAHMRATHRGTLCECIRIAGVRSSVTVCAHHSCSHTSAGLATSSIRSPCSCSAVLALCCAGKSRAQLCSCSAALLRSAGCALRSVFCACAQLRSCSAALLRSAGCALRSPFCARAQLRSCSAALALGCAQTS